MEICGGRHIIIALLFVVSLAGTSAAQSPSTSPPSGPICERGSTFNVATGRCQADPNPCITGTEFNAATDKCEAPPCAVEPGNYISLDPQTDVCHIEPISTPRGEQCPSFTETSFNPGTGRCERPAAGTCPSGANYNTATDICEAQVTCPSGANYNTATDKCESQPVCPRGFTFDTATGSCQRPAGPICERGSTFNVATGRCQADPNPCITGTEFNAATDKCEAPPCAVEPGGPYISLDPQMDVCYVSPFFPPDGPRCPASTMTDLSSASGELRCERPAAGTCPSGANYNTATDICEAQVTCPSGANYNTATDKCESQPACPQGFILDTATGSCQRRQS